MVVPHKTFQPIDRPDVVFFKNNSARSRVEMCGSPTGNLLFASKFTQFSNLSSTIKKFEQSPEIFSGSPTGNRTPVSTVRGSRPNL